MATPEAEETVAAPPTTAEAVVAEVVKSAESGDKEPPKPEEPTLKVEEPEVTPKEAAPAAAVETTAEETPAEATPEEPSVPPFKEETNVVADLKVSEKKALEEFKLRIVKAIADNEFKVPKKVVETPKEPEPVVETPKDVPAAETTPVAPTTETSSETPAAETPATDAPATETPATETPATETPAAETPAPVVVSEKAVAEELKEPVVPAPEPTTVEEAPAKPSVPATPSEPEPAPAVEKSVVGTPEVESTEVPATTSETVEAPVPVVESETKELPSPVVEEAPPAPVVEEEPEDLTPPEDVALWGVPLLHTKGDKRTDVILLKFLRARDLNVSQAFEQLKKTIIWRKTFKADSVIEEDFGTDLDEVAYNYGTDKEGHPVCYNAYGAFQNKELYAKTFGDPAKITNFLRWRIQVLEKGIKLLNFSPEGGPSALVQITDLRNSPGPGKKELKAAMNQAVNLLQDNYPEMVAKKVFINVPWYFSALYSFVAPFLTARTKSKFVVAPPGKTTEALLKFIPADAVPINYGGLSRTSDPEFTGVEAPVSEQVIKAGEKATLEIAVTEAASTVVWDLAVVGYEVSYGVEYVPTAEGGYTTIIEKPKKLPSTTEEPVRSTFKSTEPGKIIITIDNSSRKKKIALFRYIVKTVEPEVAG